MENKFIKVFDDIIPLQLQDYLEKIASSEKLHWFHQNNISGMSTDSTVGFSHGMYTGVDPSKMNRDILFNFLQIPYLVSNYLNLNVKEVYSSRLFLFPTSPDPRTIHEGIHKDLDFKHSVCLYYVNNSDGDTVFFDDDKKTEIQRVSPKKGRVAFFSGNIFHCTSTPSKGTRIICNTDLLIDEFTLEK